MATVLATDLDPHHPEPHTSGVTLPAQILGHEIRIRRMKLHISREDFVENVNSASRQHHTLSPATLARFENGLGNPNAPIIPYIAAVLSCTVDDLFRRGN